MDTTEDFLKRFFVIQGLNCLSVKLNRELPGEACIEFADSKDADYAFNVLNGSEYDDKKTRLRLSYPSPKPAMKSCK